MSADPNWSSAKGKCMEGPEKGKEPKELFPGRKAKGGGGWKEGVRWLAEGRDVMSTHYDGRTIWQTQAKTYNVRGIWGGKPQRAVVEEPGNLLERGAGVKSRGGPQSRRQEDHLKKRRGRGIAAGASLLSEKKKGGTIGAIF